MSGFERIELMCRKSELQVTRWRLLHRKLSDPNVLPAALSWLEGEIADIEKAIAG